MARLVAGKQFLELRIRPDRTKHPVWFWYDLVFGFQDGGQRPLDFLYPEGCGGWPKRTWTFPGPDGSRPHEKPVPAGVMPGMRVDDIASDELTPALEQALAKNEPAVWTTADDDVVVAIYPDAWFPFLPPPDRSSEPEQSRQWRMDEARRKSEAGGKLPDDPMTVIAMAGQSAFAGDGDDLRRDSGVAIVLVVTRAEVERFYEELKRELGE